MTIHRFFASLLGLAVLIIIASCGVTTTQAGHTGVIKLPSQYDKFVESYDKQYINVDFRWKERGKVFEKAYGRFDMQVQLDVGPIMAAVKSMFDNKEHTPKRLVYQMTMVGDFEVDGQNATEGKVTKANIKWKHIAGDIEGDFPADRLVENPESKVSFNFDPNSQQVTGTIFFKIDKDKFNAEFTIPVK